MSYGIWKKRGRGWSSIEIDGMENDTTWLYEYEAKHGEQARKNLEYKIRNACIEYEGDKNYVTWALGQRKKGYNIMELDQGSEHGLWIAYADENAKNDALNLFSPDGWRLLFVYSRPDPYSFTN